jgi:ABC-2 type transport system permease protein
MHLTVFLSREGVKMRILNEYIKLNLKVLFQFKRAFYIMFFVNFAVVLVYLPLFKSIYSFNSTEHIVGYTLQQMVWYFAATKFVNTCIHSYADSRISSKILRGDLSIDLLKPISLFKVELAHGLGLKVPAILIQMLLPFAVYSIILFPSFITVSSILKFLVLNIGGFLIFLTINYLIGLSSFYIKDNNSIIRLKEFFVEFAGGAYIPLDFFPDWANRILDILPFKYIYYWPIQFFLNTKAANESYIFIKIALVQLLWIIALLLISKFLYKNVIRNYCAVGG